MLPLILTLLAPAEAAEVQVALAVPISILVDGVPMAFDETTNLAVSRDLPAGRHVVETRNAFGKVTARKEIELAAHQQIRFEYRQKELWHIGTYDIPGAITETTVVTTTTGVPVAPVGGVGITVTDGNETVSVNAGMLGAGVVVSDGSGTVAINGGVQVTETTTTTTVVTTGGPVAVPAPVPPPAPVGMDPASFNQLLAQLDKASFADDKLAVLRTVGANNWLTCDQLGRVLDKLSFDDDKVDAVAILQPSIVDPQNAFILNDKFSFSSDAQKAQAYFR